MSGQEITRVDINLVTKGTRKIEAQANEDLKRIDPDPMVGKNIIEQALEKTKDRNDGDSSSAG